MRRRLHGAQSPAGTVRRAVDLWWLHPGRIVLLALLPLYLAVLGFDFTQVVKNVYIPSWLYAFGVALMVSLFVGIQGALTLQRLGSALMPPRISLAVMMVLLVPALLAYAIWFGPLLAKPQVLLEVVSGSRSEVRKAISTMPGVTTLTQFGVAYAIAYAIKKGAAVQRLHWIEHAGFWLLLGLALFRAFAWAERLAVIEILVCYSIARLAYLPVVGSRRWRLAAILPAIAPLALYVLFTASEYFRSWDFYRDKYDSVWAFAFERLITYYATAVNNGIGILVDNTQWPYYSGGFVFEWLYLMPGFRDVMESAFGNPREDIKTWLETFARPEFNSSTSYFRVVLDLGYAGSLLFHLLLGYIIGTAYLGYRRGHTFGLLMFPVFVLMLIESLRYSYIGETRMIPLGLGLVLLAYDIRRLRWQAANGVRAA